MKISVIGSCHSASVAKHLIAITEGAKLHHVFRHLRSDSLLKILDGADENHLTEDELTQVVKKYLGNPDKNITRIKMQSANCVNQIIQCICSSDLIICDPNYDLSRLAYRFYENGDWTPFYVFDVRNRDHFGENVQETGLLTVEEIVANWSAIVDKVSLINPTCRIVFLNYPVTGFLRNPKNINRVRRSTSLADKFVAERAIVVPLINAEPGSLSEKGPHYFEDTFYGKIADYLQNVLARKVDALDSKIPTSEVILCEATNGGNRLPKKSGTSNPYQMLPDRNYWRPAVAEPFMMSIRDIYSKKFEISLTDKIATSGSCFAQHIGNRLARSGFNYLDVEPAPKHISISAAKKHGYGIYSARYGNIYTTQQLNELFDHAESGTIVDEVWNKDGQYFDPFRPNLIEGGFESAEDVKSERAAHLKAVRKMFRELDVLVFTLGLTETWYNKTHGYVYPLCPGTTAGRFDDEVHGFANLGFTENYKHLAEFRQKLLAVNPRARLLLTVSPVPLTATAENRHVIVSTMESKSILRAVAGEMQRNFENVDYFPSYEIIAGHPFRGIFFKDNLRQVRSEGVDFVMSHFFAEHQPSASLRGVVEQDEEEFCDEAFLELERMENQN